MNVPAPAPAPAAPAAMRRFDARRLAALVRKESLQALRDPSTLLIASCCRWCC